MRRREVRKAVQSAALGEVWNVPPSPELSVYEVGLLLGIGATTVCQDEESGLRKLRQILGRFGVSKVGELQYVHPAVFKAVIEAELHSKGANEEHPYVGRGWLPVERVISLSGSQVSVRDVVLAHQFLKQRNWSAFCPPVLRRGSRGLVEFGTVGRVVEYRGKMLVNCLSIGANGTMKDSSIVVLVESESGSDDMGPFEIPVIVAAFVTASPISTESGNFSRRKRV